MVTAHSVSRNDKLIQAQVETITPLTDRILQLILAPEHYVDYQAGQYLQIISQDEVLSYSIANAPLGSHKYELHIRHSPDNASIQALLADIKQQGIVTLRLPLGECHLNHLHPEKPILFIAGGTGFAPIKSMIEQLLTADENRAFELYWGARSQSDLYMDEKVRYWQTHARHFQYFSILSTNNKESLGSMAFARHQSDLNDWQIVISGPFGMVYNTRDFLLAQGASLKNLFSDAFDRSQ